ncbi:hypothetical protein DQV84_01275 [Staphylococcus aureus]|nr:hypothetical protein DQV84_01275 [Staphylococcus aureus]
MNFFDIHKIPNKGIPLSVQRKLWLRNFMQAFFVVFFVYMAMYLIRNNFKAAQPFLKEEIGLSTLELGYIGLAFSITYGLGKTLLGYFVDGRNTKRIISFLLILSAITVLIMGFVLSYFGSVMGLLIGVSLTGFVPKNAISVANGMTGSFAYLFGDSMAKVGLAAIADPTRNGLNIFGYTLSGWTDVFIVFYVALFLGMILLGIVAFYEEKKIRSLKI